MAVAAMLRGELAAAVLLALAASSAVVVSKAAEGGGAPRRIDPVVMEMWCKNFSVGNPEAMEFYSPMYPREYPQVWTYQIRHKGFVS